ncbi:zf-HC2 domain-containing protein [Corynebacterium sphenisci]|uniref:zf-HC2 domain-containing protein n=1 Tax=Corynebacterium sphenisci TaxID=191493 RepID=UPI0026DEFE1F|nr:zf-HC2 domain-containing protein [Corynebacterium sphenisci]MDO5731101.1 zf-HC2 domain-containing protein [Corynebacterium sphenisci]
MDCEEVRAALSARLDGEDAPGEDDVVDAHLDACADCRGWFEKAVAVNRSLLMGPAAEPPGVDFAELSERILTTVEPQRRRRERAWRLVAGAARGVLIAFGLAYVVWGIGDLAAAGRLLGGAAGAAAEDPGAGYAVDAAALRLALAAGLFWAAWRPQVAAAMAPVYGAAAMFSGGFATRELVLGAADAADLARLALMFATAGVLTVVWLGGYTPRAIAEAWRAAAGLPVAGVPPRPGPGPGR